MKKTVFLSVLAVAASSAFAEIKIATIDMEEVILAHPQAEENKTQLQAMQKEFEGQRDALRDKIRDLYEEFAEVAKEARNEALSEMARNQRVNKARDLEQTIKQSETDLRRLVQDLQRKLQEKELLLFDNVMSDIRFAVQALVKKNGYDLILDKSAMRASAPVPLVMHASDSLDVTDAIIKAVGGKRVDVKDAK